MKMNIKVNLITIGEEFGVKHCFCNILRDRDCVEINTYGPSSNCSVMTYST